METISTKIKIKKPRLRHKLNKEELVNYTSALNENALFIQTLIANNIGKHPLLYRRARTITDKIQELLFAIEEYGCEDEHYKTE